MSNENEESERPRKKDKVLHTRIPAELESEIKRRADALRIPVSNLVRNILEDAFTLVQHLGDNVDQIVDQVARDASRLSDTAKARASEVALGLQKVAKKNTSESQDFLGDGALVETGDGGREMGDGGGEMGDGGLVEVGDGGEEMGDGGDDLGAARQRVFAWQSITMNIEARCADCGRALLPGEHARFGLTGVFEDRVFVCEACIEPSTRKN